MLPYVLATWSPTAPCKEMVDQSSVGASHASFQLNRKTLATISRRSLGGRPRTSPCLCNGTFL